MRRELHSSTTTGPRRSRPGLRQPAIERAQAKHENIHACRERMARVETARHSSPPWRTLRYGTRGPRGSAAADPDLPGRARRLAHRQRRRAGRAAAARHGRWRPVHGSILHACSWAPHTRTPAHLPVMICRCVYLCLGSDGNVIVLRLRSSSQGVEVGRLRVAHAFTVEQRVPHSS